MSVMYRFVERRMKHAQHQSLCTSHSGNWTCCVVTDPQCAWSMQHTTPRYMTCLCLCWMTTTAAVALWQPMSYGCHTQDHPLCFAADWLMTPVINPQSQREMAYNSAQCGTRCTIERCIWVIKWRCHSLHTELRVTPAKACKIICACLVLHNRATYLRHPVPQLKTTHQMTTNQTLRLVNLSPVLSMLVWLQESLIQQFFS